MSGIVATAESRGVDWRLELERDGLLPGQLAKARLRLEARKEIEARGLVAALIATEQWQYRRTQSNGKTTRTVTVTEQEELRRVPVMLFGPTNLRAGEVRELDFEMPVPPLGPATLDATVSALSWELEVKLDVPGGMDSAIVIPIRVLQPTALLRAGVVRVAQFALFEAADSATDGARGTLELDPVPLCVGAPFTGRLTIERIRPRGSRRSGSKSGSGSGRPSRPGSRKRSPPGPAGSSASRSCQRERGRSSSPVSCRRATSRPSSCPTAAPTRPST
jgi:hypothetical protein